MEEYYFLFFLAGVWFVIASIQDLRKTVVANWISFSLIVFALAYRAFYAAISNNLYFILFGAAGFIIFFILAYIFYYTRTFAGADAKLLMGMGLILPFERAGDLFVMSFVFVFLLFLLGAIYSLLYSFFMAVRNGNSFKRQFRKELSYYKPLLVFSFIFSVLVLVVFDRGISIILSLGALLIPWIFVYLKSFEKSCLIVERKPGELIEGDWLEKDVKIGKQIIKASVHGLSKKDIELLKKYNKKAVIKQGVPFVPAFFIALIVMVFFFVSSKFLLEQMIFLFFQA